METKLRGTWASYRDEKDKNLFRCNPDEMATKIIKDGWGNFPRVIGNKRAMELCILAEAYLSYRDKDKMKTPRKSK